MITLKMLKIALKPLFLTIMKISPFQINHFSQKNLGRQQITKALALDRNNIFLNGIRENQMI